jgi:Tol biopolymer transport system component
MYAQWDDKSPSFGIIVLAASALTLACGQEQRVVGVRSSPTSDSSMSGLEGGSASFDPATAVFGTPVRIDELSGVDDDETEPTLTADELEIYFKSSQLGHGQIFVSTRSDVRATWSMPAPVPELASAGLDYSPEINADGTAMWFVSDRPGGRGDIDIWMTTRARRGEPWTSPVNVSEVNTTACEIDPGPCPEHDWLMVTRCDARDYNHIFSSVRASAVDPWSDPQPTPGLNTAAKEGDPDFADDCRTLYFATTRDSPAGDNRADIWRTARGALDYDFAPPTPVPGLNTSEFDEQDPWVSNDERHIVFASSRSGRGTRDLYEAWR